ncbi:hypothetical protein [Methylorubrum suomiense]|uniref:Uncharacterized protein n=1 Tax=Methylorubrum suomiense TaxID=144191 RepID=A0ABQ4V388_9HYPH|nr:hypothetical protein [Methylorubrum suomiense]GJE77747.1 hypothetical protein BGCPKDLD_4354 [Methylorubrum suomiense]
MTEITPERVELLTLRARIAVTERVAWLGAEIAAMMRPEQTLTFIEEQRELLARIYSSAGEGTETLTDAERRLVADEVEKRFRELIETVKSAGRIG